MAFWRSPPGTLTLNAFVPSWQAPQNLPSFMASVVQPWSSCLHPFSSQTAGAVWQSAHFNPFIRMHLAIEGYLALRARKLQCLPWGDRHGIRNQQHQRHKYSRYPSEFHSLHPFVVKNEISPRIDAASRAAAGMHTNLPDIL
jgi:hypothetical protein